MAKRPSKDTVQARKVFVRLQGVVLNTFKDRRKWVLDEVERLLTARGHKVSRERYSSGYVGDISDIDDTFLRFDIVETGSYIAYAKIRQHYTTKQAWREPKTGFWPEDLADKIEAYVAKYKEGQRIKHAAWQAKKDNQAKYSKMAEEARAKFPQSAAAITANEYGVTVAFRFKTDALLESYLQNIEAWRAARKARLAEKECVTPVLKKEEEPK